MLYIILEHVIDLLKNSSMWDISDLYHPIQYMMMSMHKLGLENHTYIMAVTPMVGEARSQGISSYGTDLHPLGYTALIARFMGPTWGPSGATRTQVGPMLAPWVLLSGWLQAPEGSTFDANTSYVSLTLWSLGPLLQKCFNFNGSMNK